MAAETKMAAKTCSSILNFQNVNSSKKYCGIFLLKLKLLSRTIFSSKISKWRINQNSEFLQLFLRYSYFFPIITYFVQLSFLFLYRLLMVKNDLSDSMQYRLIISFYLISIYQALKICFLF
jgi:hypothetical protein